MGLDMYLSKKTYVKNWDHNKQKKEVILKVNGVIETAIKKERVASIVEEVAYWRKANAIHKWFVDNVQDGTDDCRDYDVSREDLKNLVDTCKRVLKSLENIPKKTIKVESGWDKNGTTYADIEVYIEPGDSNLLPPQEGFFFGGTKLDEYYVECLENTISMLEPLLTEKDFDFAYYQYHSSW